MPTLSSAPRILSVIPPMTQLNTPYPSTAYLTGFLRSRGIAATQEDIALQLVLELFSADGLRAIRDKVTALPAKKRSPTLRCFVDQFDRYLSTITPALAFLQGLDPSLAFRIAGRAFLPEGPRFASLDVYIDDDGGDSPTSCARRSIRASNSSAMASRWRAANRPSSRWPAHWRRRRRWSMPPSKN